MTHTSKSLSMLMASASLFTCLSNPLFAMHHLKDDVDPGCCNNITKAAVQYGAKKLENYALAEVRALAKEKVVEGVNKKIESMLGNGLTSFTLGLPIQLVVNTTIDYMCGKAGYRKKGLKPMIGFNKIIDAAETHAMNAIDTFDSNTVLKLYNLDVTEKDREAAKAFHETANSESETLAQKKGSKASYGSLPIFFELKNH